jgi:hypothetical protein
MFFIEYIGHFIFCFLAVDLLFLPWAILYTQGAFFCSGFSPYTLGVYEYIGRFFFLSGFLLLPWAFYNHRGHFFTAVGTLFIHWAF